MTLIWKRKDICSLSELSVDEISILLNTAKEFHGVGERTLKKVPSLRGKTLINLFVEPSTRTQVSFELAAMRLSADIINISVSSSSFVKGETLLDTARNLEALQTDIIVLRHPSAGSAHFLAKKLKSSIINAGDGCHEHPTQGLIDAFTIQEKFGRIKDITIAIVGDILFSRVARSNIHVLTKMGAKVILVGPPTLVPPLFKKMGVRVEHSLDAILGEVDIINMLRIQMERQKKEYFPSLSEYRSLFCLTSKRLKMLPSHACIMHPGPINRGIEIESEVADGNRSIILNQVTNGLAVRMAVLYVCSVLSGASG